MGFTGSVVDFDQNGDSICLRYVDKDGARQTLDLKGLIRQVIAEELGLPKDATLSQRLAYLRNDGGASL